MCPSFFATREEKDSTRGRTRVLQEALDGTLVRGLGDPAVAEALDLCLACKGCVSDCPTGVDMATYKSETLHQLHDVLGEKRPRSHALLGQLPRWAALAAPVAPVVNRTMRFAVVQRAVKALAGIDQRRSIPASRLRRCAVRWLGVDVSVRRCRTCGSGPTRSATTSSRAMRTQRSAGWRPAAWKLA
nr:(Fe-S)-binding protein [Nocardioides alcanivorans]